MKFKGTRTKEGDKEENDDICWAIGYLTNY